MENQEITNHASNSVLKKNIVLNTIFRILMVIAPFITAPYVSRVLSSNGVGIYSYTQSLVTYFVMFAALGTVSYGTREISRRRENKDDYSKAFWEIELITIVCSLISLIGWITMASFYVEYRVYLLIFSFSILATCLDISWFFAGLEKYKYTIAVNLLFKLLSVILIFVLVKTKNDVWLYILIFSSSMFLGNASMWLFLPKNIVKARIEKKSLKHHFKESLIYFAPSVAISLYTVLDKTLIGTLIQGYSTINIDGEEVVKKTAEIENGYYEQATKIIDVVKVVAFASIQSVMCSRASYLYKKEDREQIKKIISTTFHITLALSFGAAFGLIGVAPCFVPIFFGAGYEKTITIMQILAFLVPIICISGAFESTYYTPAGKRKQSLMFLVVGAVVNLALSAPLIIYLKSVGAAIASVVAETTIVILYFCFCEKTVTFKEFVQLIWKKIVSSGIMLGVIYLLIYFVKSHIVSPYLFLGMLIIVGALVYFSLLCLLRDQSVILFWAVLRKKKNKKTNNIIDGRKK